VLDPWLPVRPPALARRVVAIAVLLGAFLLPISCSPLGSVSGSGTVELSADAGLPQGSEQPLDTTTTPAQVLGTSVTQGAAATTVPPAPAVAPTTVAPSPPATEAAPAPATVPTEVPTTEPPTEQAPVLSAASAFAARATEGLSSPEQREMAAQALGSIVYDWRNSLPGWEIRFLDARSGFRGLTYPDERVIEVYVRDGDTVHSLAHVVAHELGHAVDVTWFSDADRAAWMHTRGVDRGATWFVDSGGSDFASGAGDFAESFAWWQVGAPGWFGELSGPPSDGQLVALAGLVLHP
jgi:hypothetical protein